MSFSLSRIVSTRLQISSNFFLGPVAPSLPAGFREAQAAGIKFTQAENQGFRPAWATRCTDSRENWHGRRARRSAWLCKTSPHWPQSVQGWESSPQNIKNFHFLDKPLDRFLKVLGNFTRTIILQKHLKFDDFLHRLRSYCWETARRPFRPNFSVHPVGKSVRWIEKWLALIVMVSTCSIAMQSLGKIVQRAPTVGAKIFCHAPRPARCLFEGYTLNRYCVSVCEWILMQFTLFFSEEIILSAIHRVLIFIARWRHNFREIAVKNCEKSKYRHKSLCARLRIDSWGMFF